MALTRKQREVLTTVVEETRRAGPLMLGQIESLMRHDPRHTLSELLALGYLKQSIEDGPYIPARTAEGTPLTLALIDEETADQIHHFRSLPQEAWDRMTKPARDDPRDRLRRHIESLQADG